MTRHSRRATMIAATVFSIVGLVCSCTTVTPENTDTTDTESADPAAAAAPPNVVAGVPIPDGRVDEAVGKLDGIVDELMASSGIPGMAVAVVHGGKTVYAKGFGVRDVGSGDSVDADTVFQLASVSKSLAATVVAHQVGTKSIDWTTPIASKLPWFALRDPLVTQTVTIGDLFSHRSGLPLHAGDNLEEIGFDRRQILERLRLEPLDPFRISYHYGNFGLTAAAEAVATAANTDWAQLSDEVLYQPLGMSSTSSRFADFEARPNHAVGHVKVDNEWVAKYVREPDEQSPAGGVSSSVNDMSKWLTMMLANGRFDDKEIAPGDAILPAISVQSVSSPSTSPDARAGFYGYGFNVGTSPAGRTVYSHSGAFALGAGTNFLVIPSADVAIVALTNAAPIGLPETLTAEFSDLVQFGEVRENWRDLYRDAFSALDDPAGSLVGQTAPTNPAPPPPLQSLAGRYDNEYWGPATIAETNGNLVLTMGPKNVTYPLTHWDGDTFTFPLSGENAAPGSISKATFSGNSLTLEYFDEDGLGRFNR
jgi:CubicO group peptidase (beta-lactamase class C family)